MYLNFTLFFHVLFFLVALHPLLLALHPLTRIEQVIVIINTQISCVDHFFILVMILKVFHLKFIQCSWWTSCSFHVELLWHIFVCNFLIHPVSVIQMIFFLYKPLWQYFLTFSDRGLELTQMIFLPFWSKLENDEITIFAFIANGNALCEVIELLGHVCLNFTLFLTCCFCIGSSSWTFRACLFELHFISLYWIFLIWNTHHVVRELLIVITLKFSLIWENYFKTQNTTYFLCILDI